MKKQSPKDLDASKLGLSSIFMPIFHGSHGDYPNKNRNNPLEGLSTAPLASGGEFMLKC